MTASLHALGGGRDAGLYYVNDPNREARPRSRDEYYVRDGAAPGGQLARRSFATVPKSTRKHFEICVAGLTPVPENHLFVVPEPNIAPVGM